MKQTTAKYREMAWDAKERGEWAKAAKYYGLALKHYPTHHANSQIAIADKAELQRLLDEMQWEAQTAAKPAAKPKKQFDEKDFTIRMSGRRGHEWCAIKATSMANAKQLAQNQNSGEKAHQKEKGSKMYHHIILASCDYEGAQPFNDEGIGVYSFRTKTIKIDSSAPAAIKPLTKPPRTPTPPVPGKKLHGYIYASYNRMLESDMSLSQPYTIDYDRTDPAIAENQKYHSNREAPTILVTKQPLSAYDIQRWILTDIIAENKQQSLVAYIRTLDLKWTTEQAVIGAVETGKRVQNRADVDKYVRKFEPKTAAAPKPKKQPPAATEKTPKHKPAPNLPPILTAPPELAADLLGGLTPTPAAAPKRKKQPAKRKPAPDMPSILTAPPELAADVLGTGPMGLTPAPAAPKRKPAARTTKKQPAKPKTKAVPKARKPKKTTAAKTRKTTKKAAKPKAKPADDDKPKTYSGHGNIKRRKLTANQKKVLREKEVVEVVVEGHLKQVRSQNVRGGHYEYYRRSEKEKPAPALRNYDRDEALPASHRPSKKRGRMFEGDIGRFI